MSRARCQQLFFPPFPRGLEEEHFSTEKWISSILFHVENSRGRRGAQMKDFFHFAARRPFLGLRLGDRAARLRRASASGAAESSP